MFKIEVPAGAAFVLTDDAAPAAGLRNADMKAGCRRLGSQLTSLLVIGRGGYCKAGLSGNLKLSDTLFRFTFPLIIKKYLYFSFSFVRFQQVVLSRAF